MADLHVQRFLRGGGTLDDLLATYAIKSRRHGKWPHLVSLKYSQIDSDFSQPIVCECRGIVLDESANWRVVSRSFDKFKNHLEPGAATIDWSTARVEEKKDGSLATVYEYDGAWQVATTGTPDASGDVSGASVGTFADYFWSTAKRVGLELPSPVGSCRDLCFLFELCGPANRIVVVHEKPSLTLLGARNRVTGEYMSASDAASMVRGAPPVRSYPLQSFDDIAASFATMSPLATEGYVVVDAAFNRVKVKHPGYVALHHAKDGMTTKSFVEIARQGETLEVITAFPEFKPLLDDARSRLDALCAEVEADYARIKHIEVQKDFALHATKTRCPSALFMVRAQKKESVRAFFADFRLENLMQLLGYRRDERAAMTEEAA